jgi:hypothetical protein
MGFGKNEKFHIILFIYIKNVPKLGLGNKEKSYAVGGFPHSRE